MVLFIGLLLLPFLVWSWRRGNGEDGELALGVVAWISITIAGFLAAFVLWG